jgi:hypothetical protein
MPVFLANLIWPAMEPKRYPRQLSRGANNAAIALSETEISDVFYQAVKLA